MKKLVDKFMKQDLKDKYQQTLYNLIKYEFPKIKNLKVEFVPDKDSFTVTKDKKIYLDGGDYTDYPACTQALLQKWLREEYGLFVEAYP